MNDDDRAVAEDFIRKTYSDRQLAFIFNGIESHDATSDFTEGEEVTWNDDGRGQVSGPAYTYNRDTEKRLYVQVKRHDGVLVGVLAEDLRRSAEQ